MTNNAEAQIAREWAVRFIKHADSAQIVDADELTAARHILATTTPPTMVDVQWDDEVHTGQCAEHPMYEVVRMMSLDWEDDHADRILCYLRPGVFYGLPMSSLTPLPGTRLDMTPRREQEPESTPDHPTELTIEADYRNAPTGTVVATEGAEAWTKDLDGLWETWGIISGHTNYAMTDEARQVLRWGWKG